MLVLAPKSSDGASYSVQGFSNTPWHIRSIHLSKTLTTQFAEGCLPFPALLLSSHSVNYWWCESQRLPGCCQAAAQHALNVIWEGSPLHAPVPISAPHHQDPGIPPLAQLGQ